MMTNMKLEKERGRLVVMPARRQPMAEVQGLRDGTTGRIVATLPRVWAVADAATQTAVDSAAPAVELAFYRKYTEGMLRRYVRLSMEAGRVPSLLGREMFRGKVTSYRVHSFEDVVIFCLDMEKLLHRLTETEKRLVKRIGLQQYSQGEAAAMLGLSLRDCVRRYARALDRLTEMLLEAGMLEVQRHCQGGGRGVAAASGSKQSA